MKYTDNDEINIAYCTDSNYLEYVSVSLISIVLNNPDRKLKFHVFLYDVAEDDIIKFSKTYKNIVIHVIKDSDLSIYNTSFSIKHLNRSTYIRLLVPRLLDGIADRFIYLDADILCFSDISSILDINIDGFVCAASKDSLSDVIDKNLIRLGISDGYYFNAGFLYINTKEWIINNIEEKANNALVENPKNLTYYDQDALNLVLHNKVKSIDRSWNYLFTWMGDEQKEIYFNDKENLPKFIHFTGGRKPWFIEHTGLSQQLYLFYKHFTPWSTIPLKSYHSRMRVTDYRIYARTAFKKKKFFVAARFYIIYLYKKLTKK